MSISSNFSRTSVCFKKNLLTLESLNSSSFVRFLELSRQINSHPSQDANGFPAFRTLSLSPSSGVGIDESILTQLTHCDSISN
jgi:hypothetical protein